MEGGGLIELIGIIGPMGLIGLIGSQKRQPPKGGGSQAIHGHPGYIMCDAPALCEIGQGRHTTYYTVRASAPEGGEPSLTRGEGYSVGTATRALPAETALMLLPLTQDEPRKKCASPSLG